VTGSSMDHISYSTHRHLPGRRLLQRNWGNRKLGSCKQQYIRTIISHCCSIHPASAMTSSYSAVLTRLATGSMGREGGQVPMSEQQQRHEQYTCRCWQQSIIKQLQQCIMDTQHVTG